MVFSSLHIKMGLYEMYDYYWYQLADQRAIQYPLLSSPIPIIAIITIYWIMIRNAKKWMGDRPAYNIKPFIQTYNILQVVICGILSIRVVILILEKPLRCMEHQTDSEYDMKFVFYSWVYLMLKLADMFDTLFFVLRRKFNLLTTLHTYHHTLMVIGTYVISRYYPAGENAILGTLNSMVHSIMYGYYFYCLNHNKQANIWWKKHITQLQLAQFTFLFCWFSYKLLMVHDCGYPKSIMVFTLIQSITMINMFGHYYYNAFIKVKPPKVDSNSNVMPKKVK